MMGFVSTLIPILEAIARLNIDKVLLFAILALLIWALSMRAAWPHLVKQLVPMLFWLSCVLIINYVSLVGFYALNSTYYDHAEANVAVVSWLFQTQHSLYPNLDAAERYINNYGPILYIINGWFLQLSPSIFASKLSGGLSAILTLIFLFLTLKQTVSDRVATICCAYMTIVMISLNVTPIALVLGCGG